MIFNAAEGRISMLHAVARVLCDDWRTAADTDRRADLDAEQLCTVRIGELCADGLLRLLDAEAEFIFEHAIHDDRDEVAFLEFEPDVRRIEGVFDGDRRFVRKTDAF